MLTPVESFWLGWHARRNSKPAKRQAQTVLLAESGRSASAIAAHLKLSEATVKRTLARFETERLKLFPIPALFVDELLAAANVDMAHARQVADHALALFDATRNLHGLGSRQRALTETAALLHNVGVEVDEPNHHTAGRDLLQTMRLIHYTEAEQAMLACCIRFHRKRVRPEKEPLFATLSPKQQQQTLAISALVRIADGLDYSQSQTTCLEAVEISGETIALRVSGPYAELDGERAIEKSDLWTATFGQNWVLTRPPPDVAALAQQPLTSESPITAVALRALADQLSRWQAAEPNARAGIPLGIKNVRAAARRARAALELFAPYFKKKALKPLRRQLKQAEDALGPTRDWDVLIEAAQEAAGEERWAFLEEWKAKREAAHAQAAAWLGSAQVKALRTALTDFLATPPIRAKRQVTLAAGAEAVMAKPLKVLRAQAAALDPDDLETYHALRRRGIKRCRFALEFFEPAFGEPAQALLKDIIKAQDRLGYLNDRCVALEKLDAWLAVHNDAAAQRYRQLCEAEVQKHLRKFPKDWEPVAPKRLAKRFAALLDTLSAGPEAATEAAPPPT
ncbi:MAG: CHAD domain-containing protein [Anaerolineales bacterium]|nr:CHAD domain-containing protein [Anaerolineales bacterium]